MWSTRTAKIGTLIGALVALVGLWVLVDGFTSGNWAMAKVGAVATLVGAIAVVLFRPDFRNLR